MLARLFSDRRVREIRRLTKNAGVTLFCLILTVIVLRGNLGAGKFGTPNQDLDNIRHTLSSISHKRVEPRRVLEETHTDSAARRLNIFGQSSNKYSDFDIKSILADEEDNDEPNFEIHRKGPYTLGPKIRNWDKQRREWLNKHPKFSNFIAPNKPRVLLVTGSAPEPCRNPVGDHYLLKALKSKIDYCRIHGIEIFYNMALLDAKMSGFWAKLPLIRKLLLSHPEVEFIWWMDSDAFFTDMAFEIPWKKYKKINIVLHGWDHMVYTEHNWVGLNTGSFLLRNCQWSLDLLDALAPMGPKGKVRLDAGKLLTLALKGRPDFEADDQSAMVYLLVNEREKWGDKVYLESSYYMHGYWEILVERFEEMIENFHPGYGDHRWPLVTHFVGCKPCGEISSYAMERCLKHMERTFHFGDNQILQMYGFIHKSLETRSVKRIRNESSNPLNGHDRFGLLHPDFKVWHSSKAN